MSAIRDTRQATAMPPARAAEVTMPANANPTPDETINHIDDATGDANATSKKREGTPPAHILLGALQDALTAGVPVTEVITAIRYARKATSVLQAPTWKMLAADLAEQTTAANDAKATAAKAAE